MKRIFQFFLQAFQAVANAIVELSQQLLNYFQSGSFAIAVYPFLMHPCFTKSRKALLRLIAIFTAFMGVFYLFGELVTVLFSEHSILSYFKHTTLELFQNSESNGVFFSPLHTVMHAIFSLQSGFFIIIYAVIIASLSRHKYWLLSLIFALFFTIGMGLTPSSQGKITLGGLQSLGASLTYLFGTLAVWFAGIDFKDPNLQLIRRYSLRAGILGTICVLISTFYPTPFTPVLERVGIYSVMVWEILVGYALYQQQSK